MSKCRYDLSEDCNNTDCLYCVLGKIKAEIDKIYERENHSFDCLDALDELKEFIDKYKAEEREQIPDLRVTAEETAEEIQNLVKAGIIQISKEHAEWLPQYEGEWVAESEEV